MSELLIVGCGGHARSIIDLVDKIDHLSIKGLVGLREEVGKIILGYSVIGNDSDLYELRSLASNAVIAIGQISSAESRMCLDRKLSALDFDFPVLISPHAVVSKYSNLSCGTSVGHGAIINSSVVIGKHCIINSRALIEHDCLIGDFCHISTGALVNGGVKIGSGSFIGSGAIIREGLVLPPNTIISAGHRVMGWPVNKRS